MTVKVAKKNSGRNTKKTAKIKADAPVVEGKKRSRWEDFLRKNPGFHGTIVDMKAVMK